MHVLVSGNRCVCVCHIHYLISLLRDRAMQKNEDKKAWTSTVPIWGHPRMPISIPTLHWALGSERQMRHSALKESRISSKIDLIKP